VLSDANYVELSLFVLSVTFLVLIFLSYVFSKHCVC
jgi:hypothetical protein